MNFDLLKSPFSCDVKTVATKLQVELIDLQVDNALKSSFEKKSLIEFYKSLHPEKFRNLKEFARKMFVVFASTLDWAKNGTFKIFFEFCFNKLPKVANWLAINSDIIFF